VSGAARQLGIASWPKGLEFPLLMIADGAAVRLGLTFETYEEDGLGLHFAAIVEADGGPYALLRGVFAPVAGMQVQCLCDGRDNGRRIAAFCEAFKIEADDITWRTPLALARFDSPSS
jgi:hypothetical protein